VIKLASRFGVSVALLVALALPARAATPLLVYLVNDGSGTTVTDTSTGTALNLTQSNGTWNTAAAGKYLTFTGTASGALSSALNGTKVATGLAGATKAAWEIKADFTTPGTYTVVVGFQQNGAAAQFVISASTGGAADIYWNNAVVGTFNGLTGVHVITAYIDTTQAAAANRVLGYKDGVSQTLSNFAAPAQNTAIDAGSSNYSLMNICLGCWGSTSQLPFAGEIAYAALYVGAGTPTPTEIAANATALSSNDDANPNGGAGFSSQPACFFGGGP
jgi:hypothetical protein